MRMMMTAVLAAAAAFADFSWTNGHCRQNESILDSKCFTGEFRADVIAR